MHLFSIVKIETILPVWVDSCVVMWSTWHQTIMHFYLHRYRIAVFQKLVPDNRSMISLNVCPCQHVIMPCVYTLTHSFIWTRPVQYKQYTYVSYFENFINPNRLMPPIIWVTKQYIFSRVYSILQAVWFHEYFWHLIDRYYSLLMNGICSVTDKKCQLSTLCSIRKALDGRYVTA